MRFNPRKVSAMTNTKKLQARDAIAGFLIGMFFFGGLSGFFGFLLVLSGFAVFSGKEKVVLLCARA